MSTASTYLSVIIPTKDRATSLSRTLEALTRQEGFQGGFDIIVADNGSSDSTTQVLNDFAASSTVSVTAVDQPHGGPASARNAAAEKARGEILLLLGDDTEPAAPDLLARHATLHRARPEPTFACLGKIEWGPGAPVTEFMRWLDHGGPQFHYWALRPGAVDPADYFYSSHLSLKREAFIEAGGFDIRFPLAAIEDTDLGTRLGDTGLTLEYHPELLVWHDHPTTIGQSLERAVRVGRCAALYNEIRSDRPHPKVKGPGWAKGFGAQIAGPPLAILSRMPLPHFLRSRIWSLAHRCNYAKGYLLGRPSQA
jgi:glycosyltransferase involved in cell wall biosynthesis